MNSSALLGSLLLGAASLVACGGLGAGGITTGADGLRTFTYDHSILCTLEGAVDPVRGTLAGDENDPERVWLVATDGGRLSVVWPEGYRVRFEPGAVLYDEKQRAVAHVGDEIELGQVNLGEHAGTSADPYLARGLVLGGCYPGRR